MENSNNVHVGFILLQLLIISRIIGWIPIIKLEKNGRGLHINKITLILGRLWIPIIKLEKNVLGLHINKITLILARLCSGTSQVY